MVEVDTEVVVILVVKREEGEGWGEVGMVVIQVEEKEVEDELAEVDWVAVVEMDWEDLEVEGKSVEENLVKVVNKEEELQAEEVVNLEVREEVVL